MMAREHPTRAIYIGVLVVVFTMSMAACSPSSAENANSSRIGAPVATIDALADAPTTAPTEVAAEPAAETKAVRPTAPPSTAQATATPRVAAALADAKPAAPTCEDVQPSLAKLTPKTTTAAGNIVYITPEGNVVLIDATGRKKIDVTTDGFVDREKQALRMYQFPTFSNDGKWLAFVSVNGDATSGLTQTLYVTSVSEKPKLIDLYSTAEDNIPYIDWSPDNETVAFLTIGGGAGEIRAVSKDGGPISVLDSGSSVYWHWRNDSAAMVAHLGGAYSPDGGDAHISVIDAISKNGEQNTLNRIESLPGRFQAPHYSPDGKFILFVLSVDREVDDLMLADASGKLICTVTRMEAGAFFAWSPNGTQIAYLDTLAPVQQPGPLSIWI
ncbi:MAG: hypothetical protein HC853_05615 [Anaerolineae bacterium]|nr:hypothetical protein [Anaerolineae bacterium]